MPIGIERSLTATPPGRRRQSPTTGSHKSCSWPSLAEKGLLKLQDIAVAKEKVRLGTVPCRASGDGQTGGDHLLNRFDAGAMVTADLPYAVFF